MPGLHRGKRNTDEAPIMVNRHLTTGLGKNQYKNNNLSHLNFMYLMRMVLCWHYVLSGGGINKLALERMC